MKLAELLKNNESYDGTVINVDAVLFANQDTVCIRESGNEDDNAVLIIDDRVYRALTKNLELRAGGRWEYVERCVITGEVFVFEKTVQLNNIKEIYIISGNRRFDLFLDGRFKDRETNIAEVKDSVANNIWLSGYFVQNEDGTFLSNEETAKINDSNVLLITQKGIEDIVENNFIPGEDWPDFSEKVEVLATLSLNGEGQLIISKIDKYIIDYGSMVMSFSGSGDYTWGT